MRWDFVIIGATGMQGKIASRDLLQRGYSVVLCGRNKKRVEETLKRFKKTKFVELELDDYKKIVKTIKDSGADVVLNCAEGDWNFEVAKACAEAGVNSLDLGSEIWMTKKQLALHNDLKKKGLVHITGCGSVPGVGNVMLRHAAPDFDTMDTIDVGFSWNSNIKKFVVPFSIISIIEEFTENATNVERGKFVKTRPMNTIFDNKDEFIGDEKRFCVRHPETYTFYNYFKHKGLKTVRFFAGFPLHSFNRIDALIELGLGSKEPIMYKGMPIKPIEFVSEVLKELKTPEGYKEKEDLWVTIEGKKDGRHKRVKMQCLVPTLKGWEFAGCNIDTGLTASIMATMIKKGIITEKGSFAPEAIVPPTAFFDELAKRKMFVYQNGKRIN